MEVKVVFRGIMLFEVRKGQVVRAYLPATDRPAPGQYECGKHFDGSTAIEHFPGLLHYSKNLGRNYPLHQNRVAFELPSPPTTELLTGSSIDKIADLAQPKYSPCGELGMCGTSSVSFVDMKFPVAPRKVETPTEVDVGVEFRLYPGSPALAHRLELTFDCSLKVGINDGTPAFELQNGDELFIYNADKLSPDRDYLITSREITDELIVDHDFKWLYSLTKPKNGSFEDWASDGLPCPKWRRSGGPRTVSVSTCFPGRIGT